MCKRVADSRCYYYLIRVRAGDIVFVVIAEKMQFFFSSSSSTPPSLFCANTHTFYRQRFPRETVFSTSTHGRPDIGAATNIRAVYKKTALSQAVQGLVPSLLYIYSSHFRSTKCKKNASQACIIHFFFLGLYNLFVVTIQKKKCFVKICNKQSSSTRFTDLQKKNFFSYPSCTSS